ncbi:MAG: hypothetical protein NVSMB46_06850 [Candidatus Saccharimonadales bacterium]
MTAYSQHLFYVYHPDLEDKATFNAHCTDSEKTIVLGCYIDKNGIYLFQVSDPRLSGVEQVTSAHEMLHAAYDRLDSTNKEKVNALIKQAFANVEDQRIKDTINQYQASGADTINELHSILGTEVRNLPPSLENYYKKYFVNRSVIVTYSEHYQSVLQGQHVLATQYLNQLNILKTKIASEQAFLTQQKASIDSQYSQLQRERSSSQNDPETFNDNVRQFNTTVNSYNAAVAEDSRIIDQFNALVSKYNAIVIVEKQLIQSIDSRPNAQQVQ